jgi:hypothetical protein
MRRAGQLEVVRAVVGRVLEAQRANVIGLEPRSAGRRARGGIVPVGRQKD